MSHFTIKTINQGELDAGGDGQQESPVIDTEGSFQLSASPPTHQQRSIHPYTLIFIFSSPTRLLRLLTTILKCIKLGGGDQRISLIINLSTQLPHIVTTFQIDLIVGYLTRHSVTTTLKNTINKFSPN